MTEAAAASSYYPPFMGKQCYFRKYVLPRISKEKSLFIYTAYYCYIVNHISPKMLFGIDGRSLDGDRRSTFKRDVTMLHIVGKIIFGKGKNRAKNRNYFHPFPRFWGK